MAANTSRSRKTVPSRGWRRRAELLAADLPVARLHPAAVARAGAGTWAVGFSGGPDSLALLLLLWAHWPDRRRGLVAFHFDHDLRGAEARRDAQFCARVCRGLGIRLVSARWKRPEAAKISEAAARDARLRFFSAAGSRLKIDTLWLGHQQDDIAETLFMRLARGSGTGGLAAPRPVTEVSPVRLRPLLSLTKATLKDALAKNRIPFCQDRTNQEPNYLRNRLRQRVIPAWIEASEGRDALGGAALSRELIQEDDEALELLTSLRRPLTRALRLDLRRLSGAPQAIWRRALHRWVVAQNAGARAFTLSRVGFSALLAAVQSGRPTRMSLGANGFAVVADGKLFLQRKSAARADRC